LRAGLDVAAPPVIAPIRLASAFAGATAALATSTAALAASTAALAASTAALTASAVAAPAPFPVTTLLAARAHFLACAARAATAAAAPAPAPLSAGSITALLLGADHLLEVEERVARRLLLRLFLVAAVATPQRPSVHDDLDGEELLVIGPVLAGDAVLRVRLEFSLHVFLEHALVIRKIRVAQDLVHLAQEKPLGQLPRRLEPAVQVDRADDSFQRVRQDRGAVPASRLVLRLAQEDEVSESHHGRCPRQDDAADQQRFPLVQLAFAELGKFVVEEFVHGEADDRVAQKFHALVRVPAPPGARVEIRAVGHGDAGQRRILERILEKTFETFEIQFPVPGRPCCRRRRPVQTEQLSEQFHNVRIPVGIPLRHIPRQRQGDVVPTKAQ